MSSKLFAYCTSDKRYKQDRVRNVYKTSGWQEKMFGVDSFVSRTDLTVENM